MTSPETARPGQDHYGDHRPQTVWEPTRYRTGPLIGAGRWCPIFAPVDRPAVGVLYTDDAEILGFIPADAQSNANAPAVAHVMQDALLGAAALGTPVSEVFDHWASRDGRGLAAGPVVQGDLRNLG